jgi:hypothetical protein
MLPARPGYLLLFGIALSAVPAPGRVPHSETAASGPPASATAPASPEAPVQVTTDTAEYCASLARRIDEEEQAAAANPQPDPASPALAHADQVVMLTTEGRRMCDQGLVVGGILRLRRAWTLLHPGG